MSYPLNMRCTGVSNKSALTTLVAEEVYPQSTNNFTKWLSSPGYFTFDYPNKPYDIVGESAHTLLNAANLTFTAPNDNNYGIVEYRVTWTNVHKAYDTGTQSLLGTPPSTDSVVIYNLTNGQQYTFSIEARNKAGFGRASEASAAVDIVPGRFPQVAMNFTSDVAGTYTNVKLAFETANRVPSNGALMVTLPETFPKIEHASVLDTAVVVDGGSAQNGTSVTAMGRNVTVYLSQAIPAGSAVVLTLKDIRLMPTSIHTGRLPRLATGDVHEAPIDEVSEEYHPAVRPFGVKIRPGSFPDAPRFKFASNAAGDVPAWVNISFRTYNEWPTDGALRIEFPPTFGNHSRWKSNIVTPCCSSLETTVDGQHVYLKRDANSTLGTIAGQTEVVIMATGIELPPYSGHTGDFVSFQTETANQTLIDETSADEHSNRLPAGLQVIPGNFKTAPRLNLTNVLAGEAGKIRVSFETTNPLPADGRIFVKLPGSFLEIVDANKTLALHAVYPDGGTASEAVVFNHTDDLNVTLTRRGAESFPKHTSLWFVIKGVRNMHKQGNTGIAPIVRTELASGVPIDEASSGHYAHRRAPGTVIWTPNPTSLPSPLPTSEPSPLPTALPTAIPSPLPTTPLPSPLPTAVPTPLPSLPFAPQPPLRVNVTNIQPESLRVKWTAPVYQGWYERHLTEVKQYEVGFNRTDLRNSTVLTHYVETEGNETFIDLDASDKIEQYSSYVFKVRARTPWGWGAWSDRTEQQVETGIFGSINVTRDDGKVSSTFDLANVCIPMSSFCLPSRPPRSYAPPGY